MKNFQASELTVFIITGHSEKEGFKIPTSQKKWNEEPENIVINKWYP